ncbi:hypothetical protein FRC00_007621, partial [Tulasnella sp. 408]
GKLLTPFGALASILRRDSFREELRKEYCGIDGEDPAKKAYATCQFLHDFVLDMNPLEIPDANTVAESGKDSSPTMARENENGGESATKEAADPVGGGERNAPEEEEEEDAEMNDVGNLDDEDNMEQ